MNGLVGLEIEVEGEGLIHEHTPLWRADKDGSLRGENAEYILRKPLSYASALDALDILRSELFQRNAKIEWSFRTSVHVHINVLRLTHQQLSNFLYTYILFEELMVQYCGDNRVNNRFCLRIRDADGLVDAVRNLIFDYRFPNPDQYRYASVNLDALGKFGSLEFRAMRGTLDKTTLETWIGSLVRMRSFAMKVENPEQVFKMYLEQGSALFERIVGKKFYQELTKNIPDVEAAIDRNASLSMFLLNGEKL